MRPYTTESKLNRASSPFSRRRWAAEEPEEPSKEQWLLLLRVCVWGDIHHSFSLLIYSPLQREIGENPQQHAWLPWHLSDTHTQENVHFLHSLRSRREEEGNCREAPPALRAVEGEPLVPQQQRAASSRRSAALRVGRVIVVLSVCFRFVKLVKEEEGK